MSERKIVVPEGMLNAGMSARNAAFMGDEGRVKDILEAALLWLSENPIVPNIKQWSSLCEDAPMSTGYERAAEWQRRMFLASQPEIPEAVRDLLYPDFTSAMDIVSDVKPTRTEARYQQSILEAYKRGKASK